MSYIPDVHEMFKTIRKRLSLNKYPQALCYSTDRERRIAYKVLRRCLNKVTFAYNIGPKKHCPSKPIYRDTEESSSPKKVSNPFANNTLRNIVSTSTSALYCGLYFLNKAKKLKVKSMGGIFDERLAVFAKRRSLQMALKLYKHLKNFEINSMPEISFLKSIKFLPELQSLRIRLTDLQMLTFYRIIRRQLSLQELSIIIHNKIDNHNIEKESFQLLELFNCIFELPNLSVFKLRFDYPDCTRFLAVQTQPSLRNRAFHIELDDSSVRGKLPITEAILRSLRKYKVSSFNFRLTNSKTLVVLRENSLLKKLDFIWAYNYKQESGSFKQQPQLKLIYKGYFLIVEVEQDFTKGLNFNDEDEEDLLDILGSDLMKQPILKNFQFDKNQKELFGYRREN